MPKLFFQSPNCQAATSELTGRKYYADRQGFINVSDAADAAFLKANGYLEAGGMPRLGKYWVCECGWEASINSCPRCERTDLIRVVR
jgi:hypothetical protein